MASAVRMSFRLGWPGTLCPLSFYRQTRRQSDRLYSNGSNSHFHWSRFTIPARTHDRAVPAETLRGGRSAVRDLDTREDEGGCQGGVETDSWASCG